METNNPHKIIMTIKLSTWKVLLTCPFSKGTFDKYQQSLDSHAIRLEDFRKKKIYIYVYIYTHIYKHIHIYIHTHTYINTQIYINL